MSRSVRAKLLHERLQDADVIGRETDLVHQRSNRVAVGVLFLREVRRLSATVVTEGVMSAFVRVDEEPLLGTDSGDRSWVVLDDRPALLIDLRDRDDSVRDVHRGHGASALVVTRERERNLGLALRREAGDQGVRALHHHRG